MIYTKMTKQAMRLCFSAHKDQTDKNGIPYVFHPYHLAEQLTEENEIIVALLHDVIEDTSYTLDNLREMGFDKCIIDAIGLMTHNDDSPYMDYIKRLKMNPLARRVKLADLQHNSDLSRLDFVDEKAKERAKKYAEAMRLLEE